MTFKLPPLPYKENELAPYISRETLEFHHGKHHKAYVDHLNTLIKHTDFARKTLEEIVKTASGSIFNNAAQAWNHAFYWNSLSPEGGGLPKGEVYTIINATFGSFTEFKEQFSTAATEHFASGWVWLLKEPDGKYVIKTTPNAGCPLTTNSQALLVCDVWEHAYYIDYRQERGKYMAAWWNLVNWDFANKNLE